MPTKFHNIFRKHPTTAQTQTTPVLSAPYEGSPVDQRPVYSASTSISSNQQSAGKSGPTQILKNTILFASGIATNAGVPWVKLVSESIIQIIKRVDTMKLNEEASQDFDNDVKAFLYIVARNGGRNHDDELVGQFVRRIQSIRVEAPATKNSVLRFLNAEETRDIITRLRQSLDSAVQLFQTGLQITLVDAMDEFKVWRAGIENNSSSGNVVKKLLNQTYNAKGALNMKTEGQADVSLTMQGSKFRTEKNFTQSTRAANVTEILENSTIDADGDIDITTVATGVNYW